MKKPPGGFAAILAAIAVLDPAGYLGHQRAPRKKFQGGDTLVGLLSEALRCLYILREKERAKVDAVVSSIEDLYACLRGEVKAHGQLSPEMADSYARQVYDHILAISNVYPVYSYTNYVFWNAILLEFGSVPEGFVCYGVREGFQLVSRKLNDLGDGSADDPVFRIKGIVSGNQVHLEIPPEISQPLTVLITQRKSSTGLRSDVSPNN